MEKLKDQLSQEELDLVTGGTSSSGILSSNQSSGSSLGPACQHGCRPGCTPDCYPGCQGPCFTASYKDGH